MEGKLVESSVESILARFDKTTPQSLLVSIATELHRLEQMNALLLARLSAMESLQVIFDRISAAGSGAEMAAYPKKIVFDAAYSIPGAWGFYGLEYDGSGSPHRWTGPDRKFSFQFFVDRKCEAEFTLRFRRLYADSAVEEIRCFADGDELDVRLSATQGGYILSGTIPRREMDGGTVLTFVCPAVSSPAAMGRGKDIRMLGLSFQSLKITALAQPVSDSETLPSLGVVQY